MIVCKLHGLIVAKYGFNDFPLSEYTCFVFLCLSLPPRAKPTHPWPRCDHWTLKFAAAPFTKYLAAYAGYPSVEAVEAGVKTMVPHPLTIMLQVCWCREPTYTYFEGNLVSLEFSILGSMESPPTPSDRDTIRPTVTVASAHGSSFSCK